jgi:hypothetical protein
MNGTTVKPNRPVSLTVICILGFLGTLVSIPLIFTSIARQIGAWYPPYLAFSVAVGLTCISGLWMMKKWAAYTYTGFVILNQFILLAAGRWNILALVVPAIVVFFALTNLSRMT